MRLNELARTDAKKRITCSNEYAQSFPIADSSTAPGQDVV